MAIGKTLIVIAIALISLLVGFAAGFHEGSNVSLWSEFVLKGVIAGQRLEALEQGNSEFVRASLQSNIYLGLQSYSELNEMRI